MQEDRQEAGQTVGDAAGEPDGGHERGPGKAASTSDAGGPPEAALTEALTPEAGTPEASLILPEPVRLKVVGLAADVLGVLPPEQTPAVLRPFRRFAPAARARHAATQIAAALELDEDFRFLVAEAVKGAFPELAEAVRAGSPPPAADPVDIATLCYLLRPGEWKAQLTSATQAIPPAASTAGPEKDETVARLQEQISALRAQGRTEAEKLRRELASAKAEIVELRRKLGDVREGRRKALAEAAEARSAAESVRLQASAATSANDAEIRRLRSRLAEAEGDLEAVRRAAREGRSMADTRVRLLLDTLLGAGQGLQRELALPPADPDGVRPADVVAAIVPGAAGIDSVDARAREVDDPGYFDALLALPQVHLVVDGYNVTKLAWDSLPLQQQRDRLIAGLAALSAQTGAEITCCFDGAALDGPVLAPSARGVRVRFSSPGQTADELIRRLVAGEPPGRPVVVVSTDKEVADGVRRSGARALPSAALVRRLARS